MGISMSAEPVLPDYKYFSLIYGRQIRRDRLLNLQSECLKPVASAFFENVARTDSFTLFPAVLAAESLQDQLWLDYAVFKVTGKISTLSRRLSKDKSKAVRNELARLYKAHHRRFMAGKDTGIKRKIEAGVRQINIMTSHETGSSDSIKALLFAVIVESWMAFEILVSDLFYESLDHGISEWRINVGQKYNEFSRGSNWEPQKVAPGVIHDPQKNYGSFLRDNGAISFQRFRSIKFWYKTAFGENCAKLFREVEGGYIRALSAVRNVILHKNGIADATYKSDVDKFPELNLVKEKEPIRLDGEIVRKLRNASIALGTELVLYIDSNLPPVEKP